MVVVFIKNIVFLITYIFFLLVNTIWEDLIQYTAEFDWRYNIGYSEKNS